MRNRGVVPSSATAFTPSEVNVAPLSVDTCHSPLSLIETIGITATASLPCTSSMVSPLVSVMRYLPSEVSTLEIVAPP